LLFSNGVGLPEQIFTILIYPKANTYFQISNDNWLVKSATQVVAQWFEDYNRNSPGDVARALQEPSHGMTKKQFGFALIRPT